MSPINPHNPSIGDQLEALTRQLIGDDNLHLESKLSALTTKETRILYAALKTLKENPQLVSTDQLSQLVDRIKPILQSDKPKKSKTLKIWYTVLKFFNIRISRQKLLMLLREKAASKDFKTQHMEYTPSSIEKAQKVDVAVMYAMDAAPPFDLLLFNSPLYQNATPEEKRSILSFRISYLEDLELPENFYPMDLVKSYNDYLAALKSKETSLELNQGIERVFFDKFEDFEPVAKARHEKKATPTPKVDPEESAFWRREKEATKLFNEAELIFLDLLVPDSDETPLSEKEQEEIMSFVEELKSLPTPPDEAPLTKEEEEDLNRFLQEIINT